MSRRVGIAIGLALATFSAGAPAGAQMWYPRGYGGYGMSRWGADPGAGYMAGLGAYARSQGVYAIDKAKADAINLPTMIKWNQELRRRQIQLEEDRREAVRQRAADRDARVAQLEVQDGTTLNRLLLETLDAAPAAARAGKTATPLSPDAIREIPFEWNSEAITLCLDQMTGDALPKLLAEPRFEAERTALRSALSQALAEDLKGNVSPESLARVRDAVAKYRAAFQKGEADYAYGYQEAKDYLTTLDSLTRMLDDPSMKAFLKQLESGQERTVGDLIGFMNAFNLRFGPAATPRQTEIYERLVPALTAARDAAVAARTTPSAPADRTGAGLRSAAAAAFKGMDWNELDAHGRDR